MAGTTTDIFYRLQEYVQPNPVSNSNSIPATSASLNLISSSSPAASKLPPPNPTSPSPSLPLTPAERALRESLSPPEFRDVHLYAFARKTICRDGTVQVGHPLPIVAISSILKDTEHFSKLLSSGFAESTRDGGGANAIREQALPGEYDYESDSDLDEFEEPEEPSVSGIASPTETSSPASELTAENALGKGKGPSAGPPLAAPCVAKGHHVPIRNMAFRTLRACIFYLYVKKVNFLPLTSTGDRTFALLTTTTCAPPCSPKSMYRLAEAYGITELQNLARDAILSQLSPKNIVPETFSTFFARYDPLREHAVSYLSQHYSAAAVQAALPGFVDRISWGELPHAGSALRSLLGLRIAVTQSSSDCECPSATSRANSLKARAKAKKASSKAKAEALPAQSPSRPSPPAPAPAPPAPALPAPAPPAP